jgi:hypothetical protein
MKGRVPELDEMLLQEEAAGWLRLTPRQLGKDSSGRKPKIPAFAISRKSKRFHPRTVIAKLARDAGVPMDIIAASFGLTEIKKEGA